MTVVTSYLRKLTFDKSLHHTLIGKYLRNIRLIVLLILLVVVVGVVSFFSIPRVLNPTINIAIVTIQTTLPGAGPEDVESLVTIPIEDAVGNVANIDTMTSTSQNSVSVVTLQFNSGVDPDKAESDVQTAVQAVTALPKEASTPHVQKLDFQHTPVWTFAVRSKDPVTLDRFSRALRDILKNVSTVNTVDVGALDTQEIQVAVSPEAIARYSLNPSVLSQEVTNAVNSQPGGNIDTASSSFSLTIDPTVTSVEDLRNLRISGGQGGTIPLSQVADIIVRPQPGSTTTYTATQDQPASPTVTFNVFKKSYANITTTDTDVHKAVDDLVAKYHGSVTISSVLDSGQQINTQFGELVRDLLITFALVFLVIIVFLGSRQAIIAASAIPLTFLITFIVMRITQIDLSFIAFFSLLLSLGLLVDDTIVVISALSSYYRTNKFSPMEAGLLVWRDFKTAVFTTTLTTVWAFVPLLLSTGIIGEFIKPIPIVVSSALISSFGVAMFITLPLVIIILQPALPYRVRVLLRVVLLIIVLVLFFVIAPKGILFIPALVLFLLLGFIFFQTRSLLFSGVKDYLKGYTRAFVRRHKRLSTMDFGTYFNEGLISFTVISEKYRSILGRILATPGNRKKTLAVVVIFSLFSYILVPLGFVKNEFFPASAQESFSISLELPAGTNIDTTKLEALQIVNQVRKLPEVQLVDLELGTGGDSNNMGPVTGGSNLASITVVLPPTGEQHISSIDLAQRVRDMYANYSKGKISVVEESGGPPAGADVQIKLFGDQLSTLDQYADILKLFLQKQPGVTNVDKSVKSGTSKIVFVPDYQKMNDAGVTQDQIGLWLRTYASGFTLDSNVKVDQQNIKGEDIVLRTSQQAETTEDLNKLLLPTANGPLPLTSLGSFTLRPNPTLITREGGKRTISVTASVTKGYSVSETNAKLEKYAGSLNLPQGYSWSTGGVNQQNQDSVNSILQAMLLSFFLIVVTMVLQFSSFRKAFIVMLVIPLSISGVFVVFALTHTPLSFPALIGILALFGIVVKNAILIVDKINQNLRIGLSFTESIVDASESRLEPIALTSFTAIVGLIPITLSNALWQGLGGAIIAGLLFSGSIMLFFIPVVYFYMFRNSEGKKQRQLAR